MGKPVGLASAVEAHRWARVWAVAAVLFGAFAASTEAHWRDQGYVPTVTDSRELWYFWRHRVLASDDKVLVLIGTSRIQADISLDTFRDLLPGYRVVQLAISGELSPIGLLRELAEEPSFKGVVVCDLDTPLLEERRWEDHKALRTYHPESVVPYFDSLGRACLSDKLALMRSSFSLRAIAMRWLLRNSRPFSHNVRMSVRREVQCSFKAVLGEHNIRRMQAVALQSSYAHYRFPTWRALSKDVEPVNAMVRKLQSRGGHVAFVRMPSTLERWQVEERFNSKSANWDQFASVAAGICIHFRDFPDLSCFDCPDGSHLDYRDSPAFTRALAAHLARRGAIPFPSRVDSQTRMSRQQGS